MPRILVGVLKNGSCFFLSISTPAQSHAAPISEVSNSNVVSKSTDGRSLLNSYPGSPNICDFRSVEINPTQVNSESAALNTYFQAGFQGEDSDDEDEELARDVDNNDEDSHIVDNAKTHDALAWADDFILKTRRRGGRQTENLVLKQWKVCKNQSSKPFSPYRFSH